MPPRPYRPTGVREWLGHGAYSWPLIQCPQDATEEVPLNASDQHSPVARARAIWRVRKILWLLVVRDLKVRYAGSALGYIWTVLDPLLMCSVYWFVFTKVFTRDSGYEPYIVFLVAGVLPWNWFTQSVNESARAFRSSKKLVKSTSLPREIWVLQVVFSKGTEYVMSLPVLIAFLLIYTKSVNGYILTLPIAMAIQVILLTGIGLMLAPLVTLVPDLERLIKVLLRLGFYASPVLYSTTRVPADYRWIYVINPMGDLLQFYRSGIYGSLMNWTHVGIAFVFALVVLAAGWFVFSRLERTALKEI